MIDLSQYQELVVRQSRELIEVFTEFETANKYKILTPDGEEAMFAYEESGMISRQFLGTHRPLRFHVTDKEGHQVLFASRDFYWFLSHLNVEDGEGNSLGRLNRRFGILKRKFEVLDAHGNQIAGINGSAFRRNTFTLNGPSGEEIGRITKQWGGIAREAFTDADTFHIQFSDAKLARRSGSCSLLQHLPLTWTSSRKREATRRAYLKPILRLSRLSCGPFSD